MNNLRIAYTFCSLLEEGYINDLLRAIQTCRKHCNLKLSDKIAIHFYGYHRRLYLIRDFEETLWEKCNVHRFGYSYTSDQSELKFDISLLN